MTLRAVIMNDTSTRYHHGCSRVMRLLTEGLTRHGLTITYRSAARADWEKDTQFLKALDAADVVVINAEGTLHHGRPAGETLLRVSTHPARGATPIALVNALYQDNPPGWDQYLKHILLIAARDSESAAALKQASGSNVRWLPDLSLSAPADMPQTQRAGQIVGDSVRFASRKVLARAASALPDATFVPTKTLDHRLWHLPGIGPIARGLLFRVYNGQAVLRTPPFDMPRTETGYLSRLAQSQLHITGRFHAVCLSMLTETPFLALASNASKIERLLKDAGLDLSRMVQPGDLSQPPKTAEFTHDELAKIRAFRSLAQSRADQLFADIAALARQNI